MSRICGPNPKYAAANRRKHNRNVDQDRAEGELAGFHQEIDLLLDFLDHSSRQRVLAELDLAYMDVVVATLDDIVDLAAPRPLCPLR